LFNGHRSIEILLALCFLGTIGVCKNLVDSDFILTLNNTIAVSFTDGFLTVRAVSKDLASDSSKKLILPIMLLVTNSITTILVGYKTW
jgi:hypothetical protein